MGNGVLFQGRRTDHCHRELPEATSKNCQSNVYAASIENVPLMSERFTKARRTALVTKDKNLSLLKVDCFPHLWLNIKKKREGGPSGHST